MWHEIVNDTIGGVPVTVTFCPLCNTGIAFERTFDGQTLTFFFDGAKIVDEQTGSEWDVLGQAVSGPAAGSGLAPVVSINHFWFSWAAFRPETRVYRAGQPAAAAPSTAPETASVELAISTAPSTRAKKCWAGPGSSSRICSPSTGRSSSTVGGAVPDLPRRDARAPGGVRKVRR
jgi:hypothetical protein